MTQSFVLWFRKTLLFAICQLVALASGIGAALADEPKPNIILILADDLSYGDLSCYGAKDIATQNIDHMVAEGAKFNSFYVSPVCSPTRAALMTGSHSSRVGIGGVLFPRNNHGLNPSEITLPELLKHQGYATAIIGKWHLGNEDMFQPTRDRVIDGRNILPYMKGQKPEVPIHESFIVPGSVIRNGQWKLLVRDLKPGGKSGREGKRPSARAGSLFNLQIDPGETRDISSEHPEIVADLRIQMDATVKELNVNSRPIGRLPGAEAPATINNRKKRSNQ